MSRRNLRSVSRRAQRRPSIFELQPLEERRFLTTASIDNATHTLVVAGTSSGETIFLNGVASGARVTVTGVTSGGNLVQFVIGTGNNQFNKISINAQGGSDTVTISNNFSYQSSAILGGSGADNITGGTGPDNINGGTENDTVNGQGGADTMLGGDGFDTSNYSSRTENLHITLDGNANDGANNGGEGDNVITEEVWTGSGNDFVQGFSGNDYMGLGAGNDTGLGGAGNDNITAGAGADDIKGENGTDFLQAKNQDADKVNGGPNNPAAADTASIDTTLDQPRAFLRDQLQSESDLDTTYGDDGIAVNPFNWDAITAATVDSQGRTVVVGYDYRGYGYDFVATRFTADGNLDNFFGNGAGYGGEVTVDFGTEGFISNDDKAYGVTTDADGNIYIVGSSINSVGESSDEDFAVAKLDASGQLVWTSTLDIEDSEFGGGWNDQATDVAIQNDGRIVVAGTQKGTGYGWDQFAVARFDDDGSPDLNFSGQGFNTLHFGSFTDDTATSVALQTLPGDDGAQRIVVGGYSAEAISLRAGSLRSGNALGVQSDNLYPDEITDFALARFTSSGDIDNGFGGNDTGTVVTSFDSAAETFTDSFIEDLAVNGNNQIYAVGYANVLIDPPSTTRTMGALARYDADGTNAITRLTGDENGQQWHGAAIDSSDRLIAVGEGGDLNDFAIARYDSALNPDSSFNDGQILTTDIGAFDAALGARVLANGKIVVGGSTNNDGSNAPASVRYGSDDSGSLEEGVENIDGGFYTTEDIRQVPRQEPLATQLQDLSEGSNFYVRSQPNGKGEVTLDLYASNNTVRLYCVTDGNGQQMLAVDVNGEVLYYDQATTTLLTINGTSGKDVVLGCDSCATIPLIIYGNGGNDILIGGKAADIIFGGTGNDIIYASDGNDVQVGGDGNDALAGGRGRSILIGGKGNDAIVGWTDQDILIAGYTNYDNDLPALQALIAEWGQPTPLNDRITNLRTGGGLAAGNALTVGATGTVKDDNARDLLTGLGNSDWFFRKGSGSNRDLILDPLNGDIVDSL